MKTIFLSLILGFTLLTLGVCQRPIYANQFAANGQDIWGNRTYNLFDFGDFYLQADANSHGAGAAGSARVVAKLYFNKQVVASVECSDYDNKLYTQGYDMDRYPGPADEFKYSYWLYTSTGTYSSVNVRLSW